MTKISFATISTIAILTSAAHAIDFQVSLDANQEIPTPTLSGAEPSGMAVVSVNTISGDVSVSGTYAGLTSNAAAVHLHGLAPAGATAGVLVGLNVDAMPAGSITGSGSLGADDLMGLLRGETYLNLHTANNGPGEIRGQVVDSDIHVFHVPLNAEMEVPAPTLGDATPSGMARVIVDSSTGEVEIFGSFAGLTSPAAAAHLHGLATLGATAGALFPLEISGETDGTFSGKSTLGSDDLSGLLAGRTYINLHTTNNGPGEIRGQVPEPSASVLALIGMSFILSMVRNRTPLGRDG